MGETPRMDSFSQRFKEWMDAQKISPEEFAAACFRDIKTVYNWRSQGIPKNPRLRAMIEKTMSEMGGAEAGLVCNAEPIHPESTPQDHE
jgi:hypothetical protein